MANFLWSHCPDIEHSADTGWRVKETRVSVQSAILDNAAAGYSPEEIATRYDIDAELVRRILAFSKNDP